MPAALAGKLDAKEWVNAALAPCGGKGGGKPNRAQGAARARKRPLSWRVSARLVLPRVSEVMSGAHSSWWFGGVSWARDARKVLIRASTGTIPFKRG